MKTDQKPASTKARAMLKKLEALAERGIDGERFAAQRKIVQLKARFDFNGPVPAETPDLFQGTFRRSSKARRIWSFSQSEFDVANCVKWAIEAATGINCLYRERVLLAEAAAGTANRLAVIAEQIAHDFRALIAKFSALDGVSVTDRGVFVMGLYDGMMNDLRDVGQPLPSRPRLKKKGRIRKPAINSATDLHVHPYTMAVGLGKQIRFSVPLQEITAEMDSVARRCLT